MYGRFRNRCNVLHTPLESSLSVADIVRALQAAEQNEGSTSPMSNDTMNVDLVLSEEAMEEVPEAVYLGRLLPTRK
jgi:hypothetical protein